MWAALSKAATKDLQEKQFTALPQQEARSILQGRKLGVARLRLLPKRSGELAGQLAPRQLLRCCVMHRLWR